MDVTLRTAEASVVDGRLTWRGTLVVDGQEECDLSHDGSDDPPVASAWRPGSSVERLARIEAETAAENATADTLFRACLDQARSHALVEALRLRTETSVLFLPTPDSDTLLEVEVPQEGTRDEAASFVRATHPRAVLLQEMEALEAVEAWVRLAPDASALDEKGASDART